MNTSQLKLFAQKARTMVRGGVSRQLHYWGFDEKGNVECRPEKVEGGIIHREEVMDDPGILKRWEALNAAVRRHGFDAVVEEAAYTWFNRLMAIRILAKNGYDLPQLEYGTEGSQLPIILQRARRGQFSFLNADEQKRLKPIITDYTKEAQAFAILLTGYCHSHALLNNVFGRLDDYTELLLPADMLNENGFIHFLNSTAAISDDDYKKVELIGWLYQFYISERKDEVFKQFKKNKKAEAKDIPAATQIFTPNWIVKYMVENTVGKIWLEKHPDSPLKERMKYLVKSPGQPLGDPLISEVNQLKLLDPAAGSGHILVEGFDLLYAMYEEEYYMPEEAVESILKNNLFGLDIDLRAAQLARFALLMKAASKYPGILQKDILPKVYAMPEPTPFSRQEVLDFLGSDGLKLEDKLSRALQLMQQAQNLGSTMQFDFSEAECALLQKRLVELKDKSIRNTFEEALLNKITPFIEVLVVLSNRYEAIAANPPYMGQGNMNGDLKDYINKYYPISKSDLFAVFIEVMINRLRPDARMGCITMESWMFLSSYEKLRHYILDNYSIAGLAHFGWHIIGIAFGTATLILEKSKKLATGEYSYLTIADVDRKENVPIDFPKKDNGRYAVIPQTNFSKIPGSPIAYWVSERIGELFSKVKVLKYGISDGQNITGDNNKYLKNFWEVSCKKIGKGNKWVPVAKGGSFRKWYGNIHDAIDWSLEAREFYRTNKIARIQDEKLWFRKGITWNLVSSSGTGFRLLEDNTLFNKAAPTILFDEKGTEKLPYVLGFLNTKIVKEFLKILNPTFNTNIAEVLALPLIEADFQLIKSLVERCVQISKVNWDSYENSLGFKDFKLVEEKTTLSSSLKNWRNRIESDFFHIQNDEEELNKLFIGNYGLANEYNPVISMSEISILQDEIDDKKLEKADKSLRKRRQWKFVDGKWELFEDESVPLPELPIKRDVVMKQLISYAVGCMMGRYRLDKPGLQIAHPNPTAEEVCTYNYNGHEFEIDDDAIIPLMGSNCNFADDALNRFNHFLEVVWGADTLTENKNFLEECLDQEIEKYLVRDFWKDHCRTYKKKPIYWLFSSEKGAFQVLVYMHRMNRFTVTKIREKYLLKHLQNLQQEIALLDGQSGLSREEQKRLDNLRAQYHECERYELLLKDCADRQIEFDLDDGVTANYQLFEGVVAKIK
tara:strand:- start:3041 stop:6580 length:3540 start_codon:yes stop_codon:yes gene_type:complete